MLNIRFKGEPMAGLDALVTRIRACRICRDTPSGRPLPHEPRPVLQASRTARILIAGQAPGTRVHASGRPFTDPSGDRLRDWMGIGPDIFYDPARIAIAPMGFCFPGLDAKGGDLPPRPECARHWRAELMAAMPEVRFVIALGIYAQRWHLGPLARPTLHETVANWRKSIALSPPVLPLPHPSWRNNRWLSDNPWFAEDLLPFLRQQVKRLLASHVYG
jgi:uracil-DNA glycosylase